MTNLELYKYRYTLIKDNPLLSVVDVKPYIPKVSDDDYVIGYIDRYFVQKTNDKNSVIIEVSNNNYTKITSNPFYIGTSLRWRIIGTDEQIKRSNSESIRIASKQIPNLGLYLPYLLQFRKK